jgi:minor histocompatibility antigen H13
MMVTVAKALDIPIKLEFPRPVAPGEDPAKAGNAMLGLGDIVLPGLMVGLALRFDLYLHYLRKQKVIPATSETPTLSVEKAMYIPPSRHWANRFWTARWLGRSITTSDDPETGTFHKTYFHSSLGGYIVGMLATLAGMEYSKHPQPALLYLVPGVLGALWLTAAARGEFKQMYRFSEDVTEEAAKDDSSRKGTDGKSKAEPKPSFFSFTSMKKNEEKLSKAISEHVEGGDSDGEPARSSTSSRRGSSRRRESIAKVEKLEHEFRRDRARDLVFFSVSSNWLLKPTQKKEDSTLSKHGRDEKNAGKENNTTWTSGASGSWIAVDDDEFPAKRRRRS